MSFTQSPFWLTHLLFDFSICTTSLFFAWRLFLVARARDEERPWALFIAVVAGGALGLLPWFVFGVFDATIWGFCLIARALWTGATVAAPIAAVVVSVRAKKPLWLIAAVALVTLKWWGEIGEPSNLEIQRVTIVVSGLKNPVRVAHFSDLQTDGIRPMELRARAAANEFNPDLVVLTGDVMNHPSLTPAVYDYLSGYKASHGKLIVGGDVDGAISREAFSVATGFEWLDGKTPIIRIDRTNLSVLGFALHDYKLGPDFAAESVRRSGKADARIALSHRPDMAFPLKGLPVSVLFSGHTHGGQVVIPGFGPPVTLTHVPRVVAAGGVHSFNGITVVLARGFGWEGHIAPRVRLFCRPHLILAELVPPAN